MFCDDTNCLTLLLGSKLFNAFMGIQTVQLLLWGSKLFNAFMGIQIVQCFYGDPNCSMLLWGSKLFDTDGILERFFDKSLKKKQKNADNKNM